MILEFHKPALPLSEHVELITYYADAYDRHVIERLMPDGTANLLIELDGVPKFTYHNEDLGVKEKYSRAWISGMQREFISFGMTACSSMMVIRFRPAGAYAILGVPMHELNDKVIDADLLLGTQIHSLREQLLEARTSTMKFAIAERWLSQHSKEASDTKPVVAYAIRQIQQNPTLERITLLSETTGYSHKQFIQLFKTHVGLTPKYFQRVVRFNSVLAEIERQQQIDWARLSQQCGFYDQAHFIREFQRFSGFNPGAFLKEVREYRNYVLVG